MPQKKWRTRRQKLLVERLLTRVSARSSVEVKTGAEMVVLDNVALSAYFDGMFSNVLTPTPARAQSN